ncbi:MAG: hypothetical protein IJH22_00145 [Firmicutes bacterium]|nr:hypothetical protein [Bacillota bacterium]
MQNEQTKSFKDILQEELEDRIAEMESPDYEYVPRLTKGDYIGMVVTAAICVVILIVGIV